MWRGTASTRFLDYEDFLRQRELAQWHQDDPQAQKVRALGGQGMGAKAYAPWLKHAEPAVVANTLICLIHQTNYLLDRQIAVLEKQLIREGGYSEQLHVARLAELQKQLADRTDWSDQSDRCESTAAPACPQCSKPMVLRTARQGPRKGENFWG